MENGVLGRPRDHLGSVWARRFSPEQQCVPLGPHGQVHKSVQGEILTPTQRLSKMLESGGELGSCDPLHREGKARQFGGREEQVGSQQQEEWGSSNVGD